MKPRTEATAAEWVGERRRGSSNSSVSTLQYPMMGTHMGILLRLTMKMGCVAQLLLVQTQG